MPGGRGQDWRAAETGFGLGGGFALSAPEGGLESALRGRGLLLLVDHDSNDGSEGIVAGR